MLCENCHLNEAEVKLTVKSKDGTHENGYAQYVLKAIILGINPMTTRLTIRIKTI